MKRYDKNILNKNGGFNEYGMKKFYGGAFTSYHGTSFRGEQVDTYKTTAQDYNKRGQRVGLYSNTIHNNPFRTFGRQGINNKRIK